MTYTTDELITAANDLTTYNEHPAMRDVLLGLDADEIDDDEGELVLDPDTIATMQHAVAVAKSPQAQGWVREQLTGIALSLSLCPLHFCDYAICFDDNNPECHAIRVVHPSYDS